MAPISYYTPYKPPRLPGQDTQTQYNKILNSGVQAQPGALSSALASGVARSQRAQGAPQLPYDEFGLAANQPRQPRVGDTGPQPAAAQAAGGGGGGGGGGVNPYARA